MLLVLFPAASPRAMGQQANTKNLAQTSRPLSTQPRASDETRGSTEQSYWVDTSPHKSAFVHANGIRLHYLDWGGHGEALLFLAGLGHNAHIFDDIAPKFTDHFHVLAMTRRGFGQSDMPSTGYDVETRVADLLGFLDALHIHRVILAGHSIAGDELTAFAAVHPERVDKLIYFDAAYDRSQSQEAKEIRAGKEPPGAAPLPKQALSSVNALLSYVYKEFGFPRSNAVEASIRNAIVIHPDGTVDRRTPDSIYRAIMKGTFLASLDYTKIKPATLSFYEDPNIPDPQERKQFEEETDRQIALISKSGPQVQIAKVSGAEHYLFIDHQDEVVAKMKAFLEGE